MLKISYWKISLCLAIILGSLYFAIPTFISPQSYIAKFFPSKSVNLGLDLRGGAYILLEMQVDNYDLEMANKYIDQIRLSARGKKIELGEIKLVSNTNINIEFNNSLDVNELTKLLLDATDKSYDVKVNGSIINLVKNENYIYKQREQLVQQTIEIIRRRVDENGTKEIDLQRQGDNYILLQVPGIEDPNEIKNLLGKTAKLGFHLVAEHNNSLGVKILPHEDNSQRTIKNIPVQSRPLISGDMLVDAQASVNNGTPIVNFRLSPIGAKVFGDVTSKNVGKAFAIVLDNVVISAPVIREPILGGSGQISGSFTIASANELALLLRAGALPVPLKVVEERSVGPSLGMDSIIHGSQATLLGGCLVLIFMFIFYYWFGMVANVALILNLIMIIAVLSLFDATLTMPGIAGIVLTLGMAVDANVLIFERIKEELAKGRTPLSAIEAGYKMAFNTIFDSNITTVISGIILYIFGAGPVKGFAVTLVVGIMCSMFTAVTITRLVISLWFKKRRPLLLNI